MHDREPVTHRPEAHDRFRWRWVAVGFVLGAVLIGSFLLLVDPRLERLDVAAYTLAMSLILSGILVGRFSPGETIRETAIVGASLVIATELAAALFTDIRVPGIVLLLAPLYAAPISMVGGWVGEMLQGTMEEAFEDETVDWPWVVVSVVVGLTLTTFSVLIGTTRLGMEPEQTLWLFAFSFFVTGAMVGFFSPGNTMIEPAIAAGLMGLVDTGFVISWFGDLPLLTLVTIGLLVGVAVAMLGGFIGEMGQRLVTSSASVTASVAEDVAAEAADG